MVRPGTLTAIALLAALMAATAATAGCATPPSNPPPSAADPGTPPPIEPTGATAAPTVLESAWGPIWDAVPPEFLVFAGAQPVEIDQDLSAALDHPAEAASPDAIAQAYATDLTIAGWQAVMEGPLGDGSVAVNAARDGTTCRAQVTATPLDGIVRITVLYGAHCPRPAEA
jgi:hypothetical protein